MKKFAKLSAVLLSVAMLLSVLTACGAAQTTPAVEEETAAETDEEKPFFDGAEVNAIQFDIALAPESLSNVTANVTCDNDIITPEGDNQSHVTVQYKIYCTEKLYLREQTANTVAYVFDGDVTEYTYVEDYEVEFYNSLGGNYNYVPGWNLSGNPGSKYYTSGQPLVEDYFVGSFEDYTFDKFDGVYRSDAEVQGFSKGTAISGRELTFKDGVLTGYKYVTTYTLSNGEKSVLSYDITFTDHGTTVKDIPEELAAVMK